MPKNNGTKHRSFAQRVGPRVHRMFLERFADDEMCSQISEGAVIAAANTMTRLLRKLADLYKGNRSVYKGLFSKPYARNIVAPIMSNMPPKALDAIEKRYRAGKAPLVSPHWIQEHLTEMLGRDAPRFRINGSVTASDEEKSPSTPWLAHFFDVMIESLLQNATVGVTGRLSAEHIKEAALFEFDITLPPTAAKAKKPAGPPKKTVKAPAKKKKKTTKHRAHENMDGGCQVCSMAAPAS